MLARPAMATLDPTPLGRPRNTGALSALQAALPGSDRLSPQLTAYGELQPDSYAARRLTILQLGDSHTAADFFSGRVRERLQQVFGAGGMDYIVPGRPHPGVRSALFDSDASDGWTYEALQKSEDSRRFYLTGFNAVARHAGASLSLKARGDVGYDRVQVAFLKQPGGGKAEVLVDGAPGGEIDLDGAADQRAMLDVDAADHGAHGFHDISVRSMSDAPVTVTGVEVNRQGDGISYVSLGFPGATVQLLQKLKAANLADDLKRIAPDVIVLAFGTNEGFNDALDVRRLHRAIRADRARAQGAAPAGAHRHYWAARRRAGLPSLARAAAPRRPARGTDAAAAALPTPPKLAMVREAQRKLADEARGRFLGLVLGDAEPVRRAGLGRRHAAADGA